MKTKDSDVKNKLHFHFHFIGLKKENTMIILRNPQIAELKWYNHICFKSYKNKFDK